MGKELGEHAHYDKLSRDTADRVSRLLEQFKELIERDRMEVLGECLLANHHLQRECERLAAEIAMAKGEPPPPDPLADVESLLAGLPTQQANALRWAVAEYSLPAPEAPDTTDAFPNGRAFVDRLTATVAEIQREAATLFDIVDVKVQKGWAQRADIDCRKVDAQKFLLQFDNAREESRRMLEAALREYQSLSERRQKLRADLEQQVP